MGCFGILMVVIVLILMLFAGLDIPGATLVILAGILVFMRESD